jgi:hypothetical protein
MNRIVRLLIILVVGVIALGVALYGSAWAVTHPESPITTIVVVVIIGFGVLVLVFRIFHWFGFFKRLFK